MTMELALIAAVWSVLLTLSQLDVPLPALVWGKEGEVGEKRAREGRPLRVEDFIRLQKGCRAVVVGAAWEEFFCRLAPLGVIAMVLPADWKFLWETVPLLALGFALMHTQYPIFLQLTIHFPFAVTWGTIYAGLLEMWGVPGFFLGFAVCVVWHSALNLAVVEEVAILVARSQDARSS